MVAALEAEVSAFDLCRVDSSLRSKENNLKNVAEVTGVSSVEGMDLLWPLRSKTLYYFPRPSEVQLTDTGGSLFAS